MGTESAFEAAPRGVSILKETLEEHGVVAILLQKTSALCRDPSKHRATSVFIGA